MTIQIRAEDTIDRGQPNRKLVDGTHEATVVICEQYLKNSLSLKIEVIVHPKDSKAAPEGPVLCSTYLAMEITDKVRDLSRINNFMAAFGGRPGVPFEEKDTVGKPCRVVTRWEHSRDPQFRDRAEIKGFLPALPGQKPMSLPEPAAPADAQQGPF